MSFLQKKIYPLVVMAIHNYVRWNLVYTGENDTKLLLNFSRLTKSTGLGFAPGMYAFLDRLESHLNQEVLPNWTDRYTHVKGAYPAWQG